MRAGRTAGAATLFAAASVGWAASLAASMLPASALGARSAARSSSHNERGLRVGVEYAEGAPPGFSGGFGESSCHACHFEADVNSSPGRVTIAGVPERFVAGERYALTITLSRPGMTLGGFQLTTRFKDGGAQAGTLAPAPGGAEPVGIDVHGGVQYANQRRNSTALASPGRAVWSLVWIAPEASDPVVFHVAANAANADETAEGDYVHTAIVESAPPGSGPTQR